MERLALYNIALFALAGILAWVLWKVRRGGLSKKMSGFFTAVLALLILGAVGAALFVDAILLGLIGLVPT